MLMKFFHFTEMFRETWYGLDYAAGLRNDSADFTILQQLLFILIFTKNINCFLNILNAIRCTFNTKIPQSNIFQREIQLSI